MKVGRHYGKNATMAASEDPAATMNSIPHILSETQVGSTCDDGDVKFANAFGTELASAPQAESYYIPWVVFQGSWYPICGHYFWDNNNGATTFCQKLGFGSGVMHRQRDAYSKDSMPIGKCLAGQDLTSCTSGGRRVVGWEFARVPKRVVGCTGGSRYV